MIFFICLCDSDPYKRKLTGHKSYVTSLAVLPNGDLASGAFDTTIIIWNVYDGSMIRNLSGHINAVTSLTVLLNGDLVSGSYQKIIIWNTNDGSIKRKI